MYKKRMKDFLSVSVLEAVENWNSVLLVVIAIATLVMSVDYLTSRYWFEGISLLFVCIAAFVLSFMENEDPHSDVETLDI